MLKRSANPSYLDLSLNVKNVIIFIVFVHKKTVVRAPLYLSRQLDITLIPSLFYDVILINVDSEYFTILGNCLEGLN